MIEVRLWKGKVPHCACTFHRITTYRWMGADQWLKVFWGAVPW